MFNLFKKKELTSRERLDAAREAIEDILSVLTDAVRGLTELPAELEEVTEESNARIDGLKQQINEEEAVQVLVGQSIAKVTLVASNINQLLGNTETEENGNTKESSGEEVSTD